jgi:DNA polymerase
VSAWRAANPKIERFWRTVEDAAKCAILDESENSIQKGIRFSYRSGRLQIVLPSGRELTYLRARIGENRFGNSSILYEGLDQTTKKWGTLETYGGKLAENITQAVARDCLAEALLRLHKAKYEIVMHVHDEIIVEVEKDKADVEKICDLMCDWNETGWAKGLPLKAAGYLTDYYKKD